MKKKRGRECKVVRVSEVVVVVGEGKCDGW
jgi:ribosomal protein L36